MVVDDGGRYGVENDEGGGDGSSGFQCAIFADISAVAMMLVSGVGVTPAEGNGGGGYRLREKR